VSVRLGSLYTTGDYKTFASELTSALAEARAMEDVAAQLLLALNETLLDHLQGRGEASIERLERQRTQLPTLTFGFFHALHLVSVCEAACSTGQLAWGRAVLDREWPRAVRSAMLRVPSFTSLLQHGRLRLLVNQQLRAQQPDPKLQRDIARTMSALSKVRSAKGYVLLERARLSLAQGDRAGATALLQRALTELPYEMELERIRYLLAHIAGGEDGRSQRQAIEQRLISQGVEPHAYLAGFFPELKQQS
jgi:hypothetical protein